MKPIAPRSIPPPKSSPTHTGASQSKTVTAASSRIQETEVNLPKLARSAKRATTGLVPNNDRINRRLELARGANALMERDVVPPLAANNQFVKASRAALSVRDTLLSGLTQREALTGRSEKDESDPESAYNKLPNDTARQSYSKAQKEKLRDPKERLKLDQAPDQIKDDKVRLLLNSALRHMRVSGPHGQLPAEAIAPMRMSRDVMSNIGGQVQASSVRTNPSAVKHMYLNSAGGGPALIAHESVHEVQFANRSGDLSKRPIQPERKNFFSVAQHTVPLRASIPLPMTKHGEDRYHTAPWEVGAHLEESALELNAHRDRGTAVQFGTKGDLDTFSDMLRTIAGSLFDDPKVKADAKGSRDNGGMEYTANFDENQLPAFEATSNILLRLNDIQEMQRSKMMPQVAEAVHGAMENLKSEVANESDSTKALQLMLTKLDGLAKKLNAEYGAELHVPANALDITGAVADFDEAHQKPLEQLKITGTRRGVAAPGSSLEAEVTPAHIDAALKDSGFSEAYSALQKAINSGTEIPHQELTEPVMKLANYLLCSSIKKVPDIALNVYEDLNPEIPVVKGLNTTSQERKIRFDVASWQMHVPMHVLDEPEKLAGRLAKVAVDIAQASRTMMQMEVSALQGAIVANTDGKPDYLFRKGIVDKGSASKAVQSQLQPGGSGLSEKYDMDDDAKKVSGNVARDLLGSLIGSSKAYQFKGQDTLDNTTFHGPQKPTKENVWHNSGERDLLKQIKADPDQTPENREHAELAYRAGVISRKEAEPMLAVRRAFALQADAMSSSSGD
jgi:hypothetical protein